MQRGDRFELLDLFRGIAAIAVLFYHDEAFLGVQLLPNAYLAVDLFFLLSGFVIAHSYDRKIEAGMTLREFVVQRLIRLYPCYLLAFLIGLGVVSARMIRAAGYIDGVGLGISALSNAAFLPAVVRPYHVREIYPYNGVSWSLFFELVVNVVYWLLFRPLTARRLRWFLAASAVSLLAAIAVAGTIDVGMRSENLVLGLPRALFSFFTGVALRRQAYASFGLRVGPAGVAGAAVLLVGSFSLSRLVGGAALGIAEAFVVLLVYPVLVLAVSRVQPGKLVSMLSLTAGNASYPVYLLQTPLVWVFAAIPQVLFHSKAAAWVPMIGVAHVVTTFVVALIVDRYFELPARRLLKARWARASVQSA